MRNFILTAVALAALARPAAAQIVEADSIVEYDRSAILETSILINCFGLNFAGNLQNLLATQGFSRFSTSFNQTAVLGGYYRWGQVKLGLSAGFDLPNTDRSGNLSVRHQRVFAAVRLGYSMLTTRNRRYFVNLGYGSFDWQVQVLNTSPSGQTVAWASLQGRNLPSQTGFWLNNQQRMLDFSIEVLMRERRPQSARLNYRIGYMWGLNPQAWEAPGLALTDVPLDRLQRLYFEVNIGFVRSRNKR
jgi:hypothetical protein